MGKLFKQIKEQKGAVQIVEASFIFPVMFIILLFLILMGNAHYVRAQVESVVEKYALSGAAYCADPVLENMRNGYTPKLSDLNVQPYRYIFGGMGSIETSISNSVYNEIGGNSSSFFRAMNPKIKTPKSNIAKFNNYVVYSTFSVDIKYSISFPIKFFGRTTPPLLTINSIAEIPVNDAAEFIRNTDMVIDLFSGSKVGQSISDVFTKVNEFISNFASK